MNIHQRKEIAQARRLLRQAEQQYDPDKPETVAALQRAHSRMDYARYFYYEPVPGSHM